MLNKKIIIYEKIISNKNISFLKKNFIFKKKIAFSQRKNVVGIYSFLDNSYNKKELKKYQNLKFFLSPTTGCNHIDTEYLKKKKIRLFLLNTNDKLIKDISSTAELTITIILNSIRNIYQILSDTKKSKFLRYKYKFKQFRNYSVGIIGYGRIGKKVHEYLKNLNFKIKVYDPKLKRNKYNFKEIISSCDILTLHIPYKGKKILDKTRFNYLKKNVKLINTSRGELIDENLLFSFLKKNSNSQYWTDVITNEQVRVKMLKKVKKFQKLNNLKNFFVTPHLGGASIDAMQKVEKYIFTKLKRTIN